MGLQVTTRTIGEVAIVDLRGRVTIGGNNDLFNTQLGLLIESGARKLLLNLAGVTQVDSSGISTLVRMYVALERRGGSLKLLRPTGRVREVLELTHLLTSIPTYDEEPAALASFT